MRCCVLILLLLMAGCGARTTPARQTATLQVAASDENLNAVLWMQTAVEYEASAIQAYRLAQQQLDVALNTPSWTAAVEQTGTVDGLPAAVVIDIDETALDNSSYQARLVRDAATYSEETWNAWVEERRASAVPGALAFTRYAAERGITVFYVTNRTRAEEAATRENLAALGFPLQARADTVLTRGERSEWTSSNKAARRAHVAREFRILLLIGDDLGDFVPDASGTPQQRRARAQVYADRWGRDWIVLPNPAYGSWERALVGASRDPAAAKRRALRFEPE